MMTRLSDNAVGDEIPFGTGTVVGAIVTLVIGVATLMMWRPFWVGDKAVPTGLFGDRGARVIKAIYPYVAIPSLCFAVALLLMGVAANTSGDIAEAASVAAGVAFGLLILSFVVLGAIVLFNRPRFLVPPHARDFDGYLGDVLKGRAKRGRQ